jgi:hypothetical protein
VLIWALNIGFLRRQGKRSAIPSAPFYRRLEKAIKLFLNRLAGVLIAEPWIKTDVPGGQLLAAEPKRQAMKTATHLMPRFAAFVASAFQKRKRTLARAGQGFQA